MPPPKARSDNGAARARAPHDVVVELVRRPRNQESRAAAGTMVLDGDGNRWNAHVDPASGNTYYVNERTGVSSWTLPKKGTTNGAASNGASPLKIALGVVIIAVLACFLPADSALRGAVPFSFPALSRGRVLLHNAVETRTRPSRAGAWPRCGRCASSTSSPRCPVRLRCPFALCSSSRRLGVLPASASWRRVLAALCAWREDPAGRHRRRPARPQARRRPSGSSRPCRRGTCPTPRRPPAARSRRRSSPAPPSSAWRATRSSSLPTDPILFPPLRLSGGFVDTIQRFIVAPVSRSDTSQSRRASAASPAAAFGVPRLTPSK